MANLEASDHMRSDCSGYRSDIVADCLDPVTGREFNLMLRALDCAITQPDLTQKERSEYRKLRERIVCRWNL